MQGCRSLPPPQPPAPASDRGAARAASASCAACAAPALDAELAIALERRVTELKARGGDCAVYAAVLERSYRNAQISVRPYMWRVGLQLVSGEAKPSGEMVLAREIDSLNVGVRTLDDVLWTLEHEAAHIAFNISNGVDADSDRANARVRECR